MNKNIEIPFRTKEAFKNTRRIFYQEMDEYVQKFAKTIKEEQDSKYQISDYGGSLVAATAAIYISMHRNNKTMILKFGEIKSCIDVKYYIYIYRERIQRKK